MGPGRINREGEFHSHSAAASTTLTHTAACCLLWQCVTLSPLGQPPRWSPGFTFLHRALFDHDEPFLIHLLVFLYYSVRLLYHTDRQTHEGGINYRFCVYITVGASFFPSLAIFIHTRPFCLFFGFPFFGCFESDSAVQALIIRSAIWEPASTYYIW
jgi:hypothetical protein